MLPHDIFAAAYDLYPLYLMQVRQDEAHAAALRPSQITETKWLYSATDAQQALGKWHLFFDRVVRDQAGDTELDRQYRALRKLYPCKASTAQLSPKRMTTNMGIILVFCDEAECDAVIRKLHKKLRFTAAVWWKLGSRSQKFEPKKTEEDEGQHLRPISAFTRLERFPVATIPIDEF